MTVGYLVHYADERDGGAFIPLKSSSGNTIEITLRAMMHDRPGATVCVEPVTEVPEWVET